MAEESTRKRRPYTRRPKAGAGTGGGGINWAHVELALGPARARQWQRELQEAAQAQANAAQALLQSLERAGTTATASPKAPRRQTRRKITDPVILESRRQALAKAREVVAQHRREANGQPADQELTPEVATS